MMKTKQQTDVGAQLQQAVLEQAMRSVYNFDDAVDNTSGAVDKSSGNGKAPGERARGNGGTPVPSGRPKGVRNKLTNLRDAVIEAFDRVGGVDYLVKLANGTQSDRAAFTSLMNKVLPTQINQQVDGGIKLELSWLGGRQIGATAAQIPEQRTQVLDLERDPGGKYRIKGQGTGPGEGDA